MNCVFKKLLASVFVASRDGFGFKKLTTKTESAPTPPAKGQVDLSTLGLLQGTHIITVTSNVAGIESEKSNAVTYTC